VEQKHSGPGIASFITSVGVGIFTILLLVIESNINESFTLYTLEWDARQIIILYLRFVLLLVSFVALGLGLWGLLQKNRKKIFAILGTIFSLGIIGCICIVFLIFAITYGMQ